MRSGGRGAAALAWGEVMHAGAACALAPATTTHVAERSSREVERLLELVKLLERGGPEPQRLATALRRSRAASRLFAADVEGFKAALGLVARQLWPAGDVPFQVGWALQAVGAEVGALATPA